LDIVDEYLNTCSVRLNESLDILPIADGQNEIEAVAALTMNCKSLREKLNQVEPTVNNDDISKLFQRLEMALEKPKDTLSDQIKTLKVCK